MNLDWHLLKNKKYPKPGKKVLIYVIGLKDRFKPELGYYKHIGESEVIMNGRKRKWQALFYSYDEKNIVAWSYFEYPDFELK